MNLTKEFSSSTLAEWQEKITKDLKGGTLEELIWQSELGPIDPVLFDYKNKYQRIDAHQNNDDNTWEIAQTFNCSNPHKANKEILSSLAGGVNYIQLINIKATDIATVLSEVMVEIITTKIYHEVEDLKDFENATANYPAGSIHLLVDPIGCYVAGYIPTASPISSKCVVRSSIFEGAGASFQNQIGMTVSLAHEYLLQLMQNGMDKTTAAKNIFFEISIGNSYFAEIAKLRAFRTLWNSVLV